MKKAITVLIIYLISLLLFSLILSVLGLGKLEIPVMNHKLLLTPMMLISIAGGIFALKLTVPFGSFRIFLIFFCAIWSLRLLLLFIGNYIGQITIFNKHINVDFVIANYYSNVSRLDTPLPFIIYWLVNYFFFTRKEIK